MPSISRQQMRNYLSKNATSSNPKALRDTLARIELKNHLVEIGLGDRMSTGGWMARVAGTGPFGRTTVAMFPEVIVAGREYAPDRDLPVPAQVLYTICASLHHCGISSYYCAAKPQVDGGPVRVDWHARQLDAASAWEYEPIADAFQRLQFAARTRTDPPFTDGTNATVIPEAAIPEEFSREHLRISFSTHYLSEVADIHGILWSPRRAHVLEVAENTSAESADMGPFFGLDVGPFAKLAFYAAKRGNLHSLYVVREIDNPNDRNLVNWLFITFDQLAQFASWIPQGGGARTSRR